MIRKPLTYWVGFLTFMLPAVSLVSSPHYYSISAFFLVITALVCLIKNRKRLNLDKQDALVGVMFLAHPTYVLLYMLILNEWHGKDFDKPSRFLLAYAVYLLIRRVELEPKSFHLGIAIGGILAGLFATYHREVLGIERVGVFLHPMPFAFISVSVCFLSAIAIFTLPQKWQKALAVLGFVGGLTAAYLSGTRGAWIAIPILILVLSYASLKIKLRHRIVIFALTMVTIVILYLATPYIQARVNNLIDGARIYSEFMKDYTPDKEPSIQYAGSFVTRMDMWHVGLWAIQQKPWFGWGLSSTEATMKLGLGKVPVGSNYYLDTPHSHNNYIDIWLETGLFGMIAFFAFFGIGLTRCVKERYSPHDTTRYLAVSGILLFTGYLIFFLTEVVTHHEASTSFLAFMSAIIIGFYIKSLDSQSIEKT